MEEKEPSNGSKGGRAVIDEVKVIEEHTLGGSEGSKETNASNMSNSRGGIRESVESMISPNLNRLIVADVIDESKDENALNPEMIAKHKKRIKDRERSLKRVESSNNPNRV